MDTKSEVKDFFKLDVPEFPLYFNYDEVSILFKFDKEIVKQIWPARSPLSFVDSAVIIEKSDKKRFIVASKELKIEEFSGHFPGLPRFPIALQGLMMSQVAAVLLMTDSLFENIAPVVFQADGLRNHTERAPKPNEQLFIVADYEIKHRKKHTIGYSQSEIRTLDRRVSSFKKLSYIGIMLPVLKYGLKNVTIELK